MGLSFWLALLIVVVTATLMVAVSLRWLRLHIYLEQFTLHHWFSWTGTLFIAFFTPAYYFLKRRYATRMRTWLKLHVFGNLLSVMLISIHFAQHISRPPQAYPDLGTGVALYAAMITLVATGFLMRFGSPPGLGKGVRFVHTGITLSFYLIIGVHILHGLNII